MTVHVPFRFTRAMCSGCSSSASKNSLGGSDEELGSLECEVPLGSLEEDAASTAVIDSDESTSSRPDSDSENVNRFVNMALRPTCCTWIDDRDSLLLSFLLFFLEAFARCFLSLRSELSWREDLDLSSFLSRHAAPRAALTCPTVAAVPTARGQTDSARHHIPGRAGRGGRMLGNVARQQEETPGDTAARRRRHSHGERPVAPRRIRELSELITQGSEGPMGPPCTPLRTHGTLSRPTRTH